MVVAGCEAPDPTHTQRIDDPQPSLPSNLDDVSYGPRVSEHLDVHLPARANRGVVGWVHGGGWADDGEKVTVRVQGQEATTVTSGKKWSVKLKPLTASATPTVLAVAGKTRIELRDVLVGEVWVCSGQSNMEWPLRASFQSEKDIAGAAKSIRK